jgi:hypothetical protein
VKEDPMQLGFCNFPKFESGLKKLNISEEIMSERNIKELYEKFKMEEHKFNYKDFISTLREFQFNPDNLYKEQYEGLKKEEFDMEEAEKILFGTRQDGEKGAHVLDVQRQQVNQVEKIFRRTQKVNRALHRYFPSKTEFQAFMAKELGITPEECDAKTVNQKNLHEVVKKFFGNFEDNFSQRDYEGFLSCFTYNAHGEARISDIGRALYEYFGHWHRD